MYGVQTSEAKTNSQKCDTLAVLKQNQTDFRMSCYMLTDTHHASVAAYAGEKMNFSPEKIQTLANALKRLNRASVNYRYNERKPARGCKVDRIVPMDNSRFYDAIRCWHYQSCDNPHNLDFDVMCGFLFSLVPASFNTEMPIKEWSIA